MPFKFNYMYSVCTALGFFKSLRPKLRGRPERCEACWRIQLAAWIAMTAAFRNLYSFIEPHYVPEDCSAPSANLYGNCCNISFPCCRRKFRNVRDASDSFFPFKCTAYQRKNNGKSFMSNIAICLPASSRRRLCRDKTDTPSQPLPPV